MTQQDQLEESGDDQKKVEGENQAEAEQGPAVTSAGETATADEAKPKRGRGRPKGSKNKPRSGGEPASSSSAAPETKRKRGRPPKEKPAGVTGEPGEEEERPAKRPRGRPRKNPVPETANDGEGETADSAGPSTPKKRAGRPSKAT